MDVTGGCRCGAVRYVVALDRLPLVYACHCTDCQTWSGSAFSEQFFLPQELLEVSGAMVDYSFVNPMGRVSVQRFCPVCHTRLCNTNMARPAIVVVRAGTLDRSAEVQVATHIWTRSMQPWVRLPDDAERFDEAAPMDVINRLTDANRHRRPV